MTPLRRKRLLILAQHNSGWHKSYYSQYCKLMGEGLIRWTLGMAFLTPMGVEELKRLQETDDR
jgi:hypothetical protein